MTSPFSPLVIASVWDQQGLPSRQSPVRMRRNSFTLRASADTVKRPRHHSLGSKPLHLLGPLPSLEARGPLPSLEAAEGAEQPQLEVTVQVVPSPCSPSPPSPVVLSEAQDPEQGCLFLDGNHPAWIGLSEKKPQKTKKSKTKKPPKPSKPAPKHENPPQSNWNSGTSLPGSGSSQAGFHQWPLAGVSFWVGFCFWAQT